MLHVLAIFFSHQDSVNLTFSLIQQSSNVHNETVHQLFLPSTQPFADMNVCLLISPDISKLKKKKQDRRNQTEREKTSSSKVLFPLFFPPKLTYFLDTDFIIK